MVSEPAETPVPAIHSDVLRWVNGLKLPRSADRLRGSVRFEAIGPQSATALELIGDPGHILALLESLHRRVWQSPMPRPGSDGVFSAPLAQRILEGYALELSAHGIGRPLRLPLVFTPEQPLPELPGLALALRLSLAPTGGRGSVVVSFLVDPAAA